MTTDPESPIVAFVRDKLCNSGQPMAQIAAATGLSKRWLEFMRVPGAIPKPGIQNLEAVVRHFGHRIEVVPDRRRIK